MADTPVTEAQCRCGYTGEGPHLCHRCHKVPGEMKFVALPPTALTGMQMKLPAYQTWACEPCWEEFKKVRNTLAK